MKLAVNTVIFGLNGAVAEGLVLAEAAGVPRELAYEVIAASAVGAPYVGYKRAAFLDPAGTPVAFALDLAAKDLRPDHRARRPARHPGAAGPCQPRPHPDRLVGRPGRARLRHRRRGAARLGRRPAGGAPAHRGGATTLSPSCRRP